MDDRRQDQYVPPVERLLAGDFSSPLEVLSSSELSVAHKREILELWRDDLIRREVHLRHPKLLRDIEHALASLPKRQK